MKHTQTKESITELNLLLADGGNILLFFLFLHPCYFPLCNNLSTLFGIELWFISRWYVAAVNTKILLNHFFYFQVVIAIKYSPFSFAIHLGRLLERDISRTWNKKKIEICRVEIYWQDRMGNHGHKLGCPETTSPTFSVATLYWSAII